VKTVKQGAFTINVLTTPEEVAEVRKRQVEREAKSREAAKRDPWLARMWTEVDAFKARVGQ
jgi:hypothetical protein